jgi:hypothetical protein
MGMKQVAMNSTVKLKLFSVVLGNCVGDAKEVAAVNITHAVAIAEHGERLHATKVEELGKVVLDGDHVSSIPIFRADYEKQD